MKTKQINEEISGNGNGTLAEVMAQLVRDAESVIEDIGEEVKQELAAEIAMITDQFEKKKNQIMEKAKKNAGDRTIRITDNIREALTNKIEQASTNTISGAIEQASREFEDIVKFPSTQTTKVNKEVSADKTPTGKVDISQIEGENGVESEYVGKLAKNDSKDEITISNINIEDETEPNQDFDNWLK
jgi:hypothetical protein